MKYYFDKLDGTADEVSRDIFDTANKLVLERGEYVGDLLFTARYEGRNVRRAMSGQYTVLTFDMDKVNMIMIFITEAYRTSTWPAWNTRTRHVATVDENYNYRLNESYPSSSVRGIIRRIQ
jgi:hypothetical protein